VIAATNFLGLAIGPVLAGTLAQYAPWPRQLIFVVYLLMAAASIAGISVTKETVDTSRRMRLGWDALKPRIGVPANIRAQFVPPAVIMFDAMSLVGSMPLIGGTTSSLRRR
jgi:MFS family permease